jgi:hypothetical protein
MLSKAIQLAEDIDNWSADENTVLNIGLRYKARNFACLSSPKGLRSTGYLGRAVYCKQ